MTVADPAFADFFDAVDRPDGPAVLAAGLQTLSPDVTVLGCPSTWGTPRLRRVHEALASIGRNCITVPRAVLIAAGHADAAVRTCVVVETALVPDYTPAGDPRWWSVQSVVRGPDGWRIERCAAVPEGSERLGALLADADLVVVDGPDPGAVEQVRAGADSKRVTTADPDLVKRHGHRFAPPPDDFGFVAGPRPRRSVARWIPLMAAVAALLTLVVVGAIGHWSSPGDTGLQPVGPVQVAVPGDWQRTELDGERADDGRGLRAVFADRSDGRRLVIVVTALRPGATRGTVAESLRNRIAQRGDDVVVEFAADGTYAGREVITYREAPASGPAINWYVTVESGLQVSVGCQAGTGGTSVEEHCRGAVGGLRFRR